MTQQKLTGLRLRHGWPSTESLSSSSLDSSGRSVLQREALCGVLSAPMVPASSPMATSISRYRRSWPQTMRLTTRVNTLKRQVGRPTAISMANHRPARPDRHAALAHRAAPCSATLAGRLARVIPSPPPATEGLPNVAALRSVLTSGAFPATIRTDQIALRGAESCTRG